MKRSKAIFLAAFALIGAASIWLAVNDSARVQNVKAGVYIVQVSSDLMNWTDALGPISANLESMSMLVHPSGPYQYCRIKRIY